MFLFPPLFLLLHSAQPIFRPSHTLSLLADGEYVPNRLRAKNEEDPRKENIVELNERRARESKWPQKERKRGQGHKVVVLMDFWDCL